MERKEVWRRMASGRFTRSLCDASAMRSTHIFCTGTLADPVLIVHFRPEWPGVEVPRAYLTNWEVQE